VSGLAFFVGALVYFTDRAAAHLLLIPSLGLQTGRPLFGVLC